MTKYARKGFVIQAKENITIAEYKTGECGDGCCTWRDCDDVYLNKGDEYEIRPSLNTFVGYTLDGFEINTEAIKVLDIPEGYKLVSTLSKAAKPYLSKWNWPCRGYKVLIPINNER